MIFHYCSEGDGVLSIAREYGVSPVRLIEENGLSDPDRLAVGQCIAIYRSSRSYTVRGGDTFEGIRRRFGLTVDELLKFNPGIGERRLLYPGQDLALGRVESSYGPLTVNGYVSKSISMAKLRFFASALTYLTIIDSDFSQRSGFGSHKERDLIDFSLQNGILPLVSVRPFGDPERFAERILQAGYRGARLEEGSTERALEPYFKALKAAGLASLAPYLEGESSETADWLTVPFGDHRKTSAKRFSEMISDSRNAYRLMPELPYCGIELAEPDQRCIRTLPLSDCPHLAYRRNAPITLREDGKSRISFTTSVSGRHEHREILFDDLACIKNGLTLLGESGICALSIYPEWCPYGLPTLLHRCFDVIRAGCEKSDERCGR